MNTITGTSIHINVSEIKLLKLILIDFIFLISHVHGILLSISTWGINNPLIVSNVSNALFSLWAFTVFKFFYTSASIEESKIIYTFLTLISA